MNITLTLTATPEFLAVFQGLADAFGGKQSTPKENKPAAVKNLNGSENGNTAAKGQAAATTSTEEVTIDQLKTVVHEKAQGGKRDAVKALLAEFSVAKVTALDKNQYGAFLTKLKAL